VAVVLVDVLLFVLVDVLALIEVIVMVELFSGVVVGA